MRHFKPKMKDGMGKDVGVSPEVHAEWADKEGKHSSMGIKGMGGPGAGTPVVKEDARNFSDAGRGSESGTIAKSQGKGGGSPFPKIGSGGPRTGPMQSAGKGAEGSTKGPGGAGRLNKGNGGTGEFSSKAMSGMTNGKKIRG